MIEVSWNPLMTSTAVNGTSNINTNTQSFEQVMQQTQNAVSAPQSLESIFAKASEQYQVPENLLKAIAKAESGFQTDAVSRCGAGGVMQLMPATAKALGVSDVFNAEQNIMGGAKYISQLLKSYDGNQKLALAAYNAGSGNVAKYGGVPPFTETQNYVKKVLGYLGEQITVPNTYTSPSVSNTPSTKNFSTSADASSWKDLSTVLKSEDTQPINLIDTNFTYEDYQLFIKLFLARIDQQVSLLGNDTKESEERKHLFAL